jgi:hypothetical protein
LKNIRSSFPNYALFIHTTYSSSQSHGTVPLKHTRVITLSVFQEDRFKATLEDIRKETLEERCEEIVENRWKETPENRCKQNPGGQI